MKKLIHVVDKDKRKRKRVELFSNIPAKIQALGKSIKAKIKDVSYEGIGVVLEPNQEFPTMESLEAKVELPDQFFKGKIANKIILPNQEIKIGLVLPSEGNKEIDFNMTDSAWDKVTDLETVQNIYSDLAFKGLEAPIEIRQNFSRAVISPMEVTSNQSMICEIVEIQQGAFEKGKAKCMFNLFQTCHAFDTNIEQIDQKRIEIKLPSTLARLLRRETVRIQKEKADFELKIRLINRELETTIEEYEVFDYSEHGISILDPEGELSLPRNLVFNEAIIEVIGLGIILGKAEVRSYQWNQNIGSYIVGLKFQPNQEPHFSNWLNIVLKARYPNIDFEYHEDDHKKIWDLFDRTGYLATKPKESFELIVDITKDVWKITKNAGSNFCKRIQFKNESETLGHTQIDRLYPNTWTVHALAFDKKMNKLVANSIYASLSDIFGIFENSYMMSISNSKLGWNQKNYYDFVKNSPHPDQGEIKLFHLHEGVPAKEYKLKIQEDITIKLAEKYDLKIIQRFLEENISKVEIEALSYISDPHLEIYCKELTKHSLFRHRDYLFATKNGKFAGFSVLETGTVGVSVFAIQETMYVYVDQTFSKSERVEIQDALIKKSMEYYLQKNRPSINIYFVEDDIAYYQNLGFKYFMTGARWINKTVASKRYNAFTNNLYGHLILRREKIRKKNEE